MTLLGGIRKHGNSLRTQAIKSFNEKRKREQKNVNLRKMMGEGNKESLVTERKYAKL